MVNVRNKKDCCSCGACSQACPKSCITMNPDKLTGFRYPQVSTQECISCGICDQVCPVHVEREPRKPISIHSYQNPDKNILLKSSSGGFFTEFAMEVIKKGGVVFGAKFNDQWQVEIDYTESIEGLEAFRGSKYVQASTGTSYKDAHRFLKTGRTVLYTGTPCQIAGLKQFLKKDYNNLILVDLICHGTPSPKVWKAYVKEKSKKQNIRHISFRDKSLGWENYSIVMGDYKSDFRSDPYMRLFLNNQDLAECCYDCPFKDGRSGSDYTIGDFWGAPDIQLNRQNGIGVILDYSSRYNIHLEGQEFSLKDVTKGNPSIIKSPQRKGNFTLVYSLLASGFSVTKTETILNSHNFVIRCIRKAFKLITR